MSPAPPAFETWRISSGVRCCPRFARHATYGATYMIVLFSSLNFPTGNILEVITQGSIITPAQFPKNSQGTAGQLTARFGGVFVWHSGITAPYGACAVLCSVIPFCTVLVRRRTVLYGLRYGTSRRRTFFRTVTVRNLVRSPIRVSYGLCS